ncbi:hypothetical protein [Brevibacillus choshinensis]|uniref:Uncharacterized protein n=1 Tax=Brevibacillus choshinensis TaxID=54911 RepID=A0ABX7FWN7_BRECH|nr:hypothetical protein [Brevibacillus choshinensis]QRG69952.1 hypothetical protein JNE38_12985 [Brevibacillus choshinensis]
MYVRPKLLWWLVPIFLSLFFIGIALGSMGTQGDMRGGRVMEHGSNAGIPSVTLPELLDQLTKEQERTFVVYMQNQALNGKYQNESFELSGEIAGHRLEISRNAEQKVNVVIDGQTQQHTSLPYALYTPHEHANLIKSVLHSVSPQPVQDPSGQGWRGFRLSMPASEVTSLLALWLGPSFSIEELTPELAKGIGVTYQLWYEPATGDIRQMDMELQMKTGTGEKRDELRFRL